MDNVQRGFCFLKEQTYLQKQAGLKSLIMNLDYGGAT